ACRRKSEGQPHFLSGRERALVDGTRLVKADGAHDVVHGEKARRGIGSTVRAAPRGQRERESCDDRSVHVTGKDCGECRRPAEAAAGPELEGAVEVATRAGAAWASPVFPAARLAR